MSTPANTKRDEKKSVISQHAAHDKDTGSLAVQIALLSQKISDLTEHLKSHKKDNHSRQGLYRSVAQRRKLLRHMQQTDASGYRELVETLGIRVS